MLRSASATPATDRTLFFFCVLLGEDARLDLDLLHPRLELDVLQPRLELDLRVDLYLWLELHLLLPRLELDLRVDLELRLELRLNGGPFGFGAALGRS